MLKAIPKPLRVLIASLALSQITIVPLAWIGFVAWMDQQPYLFELRSGAAVQTGMRDPPHEGRIMAPFVAEGCALIVSVAACLAVIVIDARRKRARATDEWAAEIRSRWDNKDT